MPVGPGRSLAPGVNAVLLDIEGTTTPIAFVTEVLFPYARRHLRPYLEQHTPGGANLDEAVASFERLMDRDSKAGALKQLQGKIWEEGYRRGDLVANVFADVPRALRRWRERCVPVGIFSSGSVLAQQLLFRHSTAGDLSAFLHWYFDTDIGPKREPESYRRIAQAIGWPADAILFVSDVTGELDAASAAGMQVRLSVREGNAPQPGGRRYQAITSFDELIA
jgi:enolase-phosphatase E1